MSSDATVSSGDDPAHRTIAALSLALASGTSLADVAIDLSDPEQCRFGAYTLVERIGGGGMGVVYRARQQSLERDVAIKLLNVRLGEDDEALARFRFEAKAAAALNHPNIVQVLEIGQQQGIAFIAMQLVRGETLAGRIARGRLSPKDAVAILLKLCDAVGYAHKLHLLHLDLKPANVLIDERGEPLVADFGLARRMDAKGQVEAQEVSGTPAYMAPEQVLIKQFRLSAQTDIYALGAIAYEMLCGIAPHGRGNPAEVLQRALAGQIPNPRQFVPKLPRDLEAICLKCLALRAEDRYPSVESLADDLRRHANALPVSARRASLRERMQRWYAREPRFALAIAAMLLLTLTASAVMTSLYRTADRERSGSEGILYLVASKSPDAYWDAFRHFKQDARIPLVDCSLPRVHCGGGVGNWSTIDDYLPDADRERYLVAMHDYGSRIMELHSPKLADQVARALDRTGIELKNHAQAPALAATGTTDGLVFAYVLSRRWSETADEARLRKSWLDAALGRVDKPWQAFLLAHACFDDSASCRAADQRLRELDPGNAESWLVDVWTGGHLDGQILRAAASPRIDRHEAEIDDAAIAFAQHVMPALEPRLRQSPAAFAASVQRFLAQGGEPFNANYFSSINYPSEYCRRAVTERHALDVEKACLAIFEKVGPSMKPDLHDELVASEMIAHLSRDPAERARALQRYRDARWIDSSWQTLTADDVGGDERYIAISRSQGKLAFLRTVVAASRRPLEAPPEFVTLQLRSWHDADVSPPAAPR